MICGSDGILAKPTNDNGKIANGSFRFCVVCGGSGTYLGNSLKIGPTVVGPDGPTGKLY
jgi:hypothetical protein